MVMAIFERNFILLVTPVKNAGSKGTCIMQDQSKNRTFRSGCQWYLQGVFNHSIFEKSYRIGSPYIHLSLW
jgi:hypothetical protein